MEKCIRCRKSDEEVRLFDGLYINDTVKICERCALLTNTPIIKRPSTNQLRNSEKPYGVRERLMRMAHLSSGEKKEKSVVEEIKELESTPELEQPEDLVFKLVDNFHWIIQTERRRKGLTVRQLAESTGESESSIKLLEKGIVPNKSIDLIRAIEQFLNIRLIKRDLIEQIEEKRRGEERVNAIMAKKQVIIPEKKEIILENPEANPLGSSIPAEHRPLRFSRKEAENIKVRDLQRLSKKIDDDMEYEKKTSFEVGEEQLDGFGKENTDKLKKSIFRENTGKTKSKSSVPTIYELMKKKEEHDKTSLVGSDIEIVDEDNSKKQ